MRYNRPRIDLFDSMLSMFTKMAEGNPGAITVLMRTVNEGPAIDPQSAFAEISVILALDKHDIYGAEIWQLYKDVCCQNLTMMLALLRAVQLGMLSESELKRAIHQPQLLTDERKEELLAEVKSRLKEFGRNGEVPA